MALELLSFVNLKVAPDARMWQPSRTGDFGLDQKMGRNYADELVVAMTEEDVPHLLGHIVKAMTFTGVFGPLEVSFFSRLAEYTVCTQRNYARPIPHDNVVPLIRAS